MRVKVKKEFELHSNHTAHKEDILNLITINYENDSLFIILEKYNHIFNVYFKDEFDANEHLEFNYQELMNKDVYVSESEMNKRIAEVCQRKDKEIDMWKAKFMKLLDKI